jgi:hypothetical protein
VTQDENQKLVKIVIEKDNIINKLNLQLEESYDNNKMLNLK